MHLLWHTSSADGHAKDKASLFHEAGKNLCILCLRISCSFGNIKRYKGHCICEIARNRVNLRNTQICIQGFYMALLCDSKHTVLKLSDIRNVLRNLIGHRKELPAEVAGICKDHCKSCSFTDNGDSLIL